MPEPVIARLRAAADPGQLDLLADMVLAAPSLELFVQGLEGRERP